MNKQNKNVKIYLVLNDNVNDSEFEKLHSKIFPNSTWEEIKKGTLHINGIEINGGIWHDHTSLYLKSCKFDNADFSIDCGKSVIDGIKNYFACQCSQKIINNIFIQVDKEGLSHSQLSYLSKKYASGESTASGVLFYNFGKTYILNKTFFDSDYAVFKRNIAHEAVNSFKADNGKRYFYLCKDGKLNDYVIDINHIKKLPTNYIDLSKATLINFSKISEGDKSKYLILQKVDDIVAHAVAFDKNRDLNKYSGITYYGVNICDVFDENSFSRKNKETGESIDVTENYPFITFEAKNNQKVLCSSAPIMFSSDDAGFKNLASSSCRQFVLEGTSLYNAINNLVENDAIWHPEQSKTLQEYINSESFSKDNEENYLLKIIGKKNKETYYSKLLTFVFANSKDIIQKYCASIFCDFPRIKEITGIYNEKYNMDLCFTFIDSYDKEHLVVLENKIEATFTEQGIKSLESFFNQAEYKGFVEEENNKLQILKNDTSKNVNQLTKYHQIAAVIAKSKGIDSNNIKYIVLAPEYKKDFYQIEKNKFYYGEEYIVSSYKILKEAIDVVINDANSDFHSISQDVKDIIIQFSRSIWPYISDSYAYYQRTMSNRFAREAKKKAEK